MAQKWPKLAHNYPKWPKNYAKNLRTFSVIFFDWKGGPANFFAFRMYARCILAMFLVTISNKLKIAANPLKFAPNLKASGKCMGVLMTPKLKSKSHNLSKKAHLSGSWARYNNVHVNVIKDEMWQIFMSKSTLPHCFPNGCSSHTVPAKPKMDAPHV